MKEIRIEIEKRLDDLEQRVIEYIDRLLGMKLTSESSTEKKPSDNTEKAIKKAIEKTVNAAVDNADFSELATNIVTSASQACCYKAEQQIKACVFLIYFMKKEGLNEISEKPKSKQGFTRLCKFPRRFIVGAGGLFGDCGLYSEPQAEA